MADFIQINNNGPETQIELDDDNKPKMELDDDSKPK